MKNLKNKIAFIFMTAAVLVMAACYVPSPLYGTWADNNGNKISFISDGTFVANIVDSTGTTTTYQGDYTVMDNVVCFSTTDGLTINSEWDIRGQMLYMTWTKSGVTYNLTLYHTSK